MSEFTGERVIPGQVGVDLWNEHIARYSFAARFADGKRVLDLGCGTGYGAAALAQAAREVVGVDVSAEAVEYAREHFAIANLRFAESSATKVREPDASFDLITAFEIIEHIEAWPALLTEARRLLSETGVFLVSTPNRSYYAESRGDTGPNPYHVHEFEFDEFEQALRQHFPNVTILLQDRIESFAFYPYRTPCAADARIEGGAGTTDNAHFFLGVCGLSRALDDRAFLYVPRTANILREREQHIALLDAELAQNRQWLADTQRDHGQLLKLHGELKDQLEKHNRWALQLEKDWKLALERIAQLQNEFRKEQAAASAVVEQYEAKIRALESDNVEKTNWALDTERRLTGELDERGAELAAAVEALHATEAELADRTKWALSLEKESQELRTILGFVQSSRWVKLGRAVGVGPKVGSE